MVRKRLVWAFPLLLPASSAGFAQDCDGDGFPDSSEVAPLRVALEGVVELDAGFAALGLEMADLTGDGLKDLIAWSRGSDAIAVFSNLGGRRFGPREPYVLDISADVQVLPADVDSDGDVDLCGSSSGSSSVVCLRNDGTGALSGPFTLFNAGDAVAKIVAGDFDADGETDLVALRRQNPQVHVWLQSPRVGVSRETAYPTAGGQPGYLASCADFNVDGKLDLVVMAASNNFGTLQIFFGQGDGTLGIAVKQDFSGFPQALAVLDWNQDSRTDLVLLEANNAQLVPFLSQGTEQLVRAASLATRPYEFLLLAADMDMDGDDDLFALQGYDACGVQKTNAILHEADAGALGPATPLDAPPRVPATARVGDFDGDARPDVALAQPVGVTWNVPADAPRDCNADGVPDDCQLKGNDCDSNGILDACDVERGASDCNRNEIPDACERDCDSNGKPDDCDVADGAPDQNGDAIPDSCARLITDCNLNGLDDPEELRSGAASDCNQNGVPDACDAAPRIVFTSALDIRVKLESWPTAVASGDFNEDGVPDLVVALNGVCCPPPVKAPRLEVFLGTLDGRLYSAGGMALSDTMNLCHVADFDGDHHLDLAAQSFGYSCDGHTSFGVSIITGRGNGTFVPARWAFGANLGTPVAAGDTDGDEDVDLIAVGSIGLDEWMNDGRGRFTAAPPLEVAGGAMASAILDLDSDGRLDALALRNEPVAVFAFSERPDGSWEKPNVAPLPRSLGSGVLIGDDLDQDGDTDLVTGEQPAGPGTPFLAVYWQAGKLQFDTQTQIPTRNWPWTNFVRDIDGDQDLDLVSANRAAAPFSGSGPGFYTVAINEGRGKLSRPTSGRIVWDVAGVTLDDFDGDGGVDLAAVGSYRSELEISHFVAPGAFQAALDVNAPGGPRDVAAADMNGDEKPDLVIASQNSKRIQVALNSRVGLFAPPLETPTGSAPIAVAVADLDGDGDIDVAAAETLRVEAFTNDGSGKLTKVFSVNLGSGPIDIAAADLDGDHDVDLVTANTIPEGDLPDNVTVLENDGRGSFLVPRNLAAGKWQSSIEASDMDSDGLLDLVIGILGSLEVSIFKNQGGLSFSLWGQYLPGATQGVTSAKAADIDADADLDLLLVRPTEIAVLRNRGGIFSTPEGIPVDPHQAIAPGDFDGDGAIDIAVALLDERFAVLTNDVQGHFSNPELGIVGGGGSGDSPPQPTAWALVASDLDQDGRLDLVQPILETDTVHVLLNRTARRWADRDSSGVPDSCEEIPAAQMRRGDVNSDGRVDLSDAIAILRHLFLTGEALACEKSADADDDGGLNVTDAIRILRFLFLGADPPPEPWGACGPDPTPDLLGCGQLCPDA